MNHGDFGVFDSGFISGKLPRPRTAGCIYAEYTS